MAAANMTQWRSPPPQETPLVEPSSLPASSILNQPMSPLQKQDLNGHSLLPQCEHGQEDGDMHSHAFDLLSLSTSSAKESSASPIPGSVPTPSVLSQTRPIGITPPSLPKQRRMSSSTTGVLGRGKLGVTTGHPITPNGRSTSTQHIPHSTSNRKLGSSSGTPQLFDFAKTDGRPVNGSGRPAGQSRSVSISGPPVAGSLPTKSLLQAQASMKSPVIFDDIELDMTFDPEDDDDSGSINDDDFEMDDDVQRLALGTGSGGIKGRRKGMVFKCDNCGKEYRHPSCLIKHRWEHSPHWKEPTQVSMSKHQQVQMLEAAAILAHLDPNQGRSLPTDKSLWPMMLSPPGENAQLRRPSVSGSRDPSSVRSPQSSVIAPLTPSSLRDGSVLTNMQPRKSSPGSDSTTSSLGDAYTQANGVDVKPVNGHHRPNPNLSTSIPGPGTPHSVGSLPTEMAGLHFYPGGGISASNGLTGVSPIPNRNMPSSLGGRVGLVGGGMFGAINTSVPSSSVRSGAMADDEEEADTSSSGRSIGRSRGKSSSAEAEERRKGREGEEWGMAMEMEL